MNTVASAGADFVRDGTVELPGRSLHYVECGAGRPVVLLHGYTDSWRSFGLVLSSLSLHCRCLALDQRGHGASAYGGDDYSMAAFAADVAEFINELRLGPVALVGHSMGSLVARKVALAHPELVDRLVLVGAPLRLDTVAVRELAAEVARFDDAVPRPFVEEFQASCIADRSAVPAWFFDACVTASAGVPARIWQATLTGLLAANPAAGLDEIACPALVVGGRQDAFFGPDEQAELAAALPRGRLLLYDGVGHSPHWERPGRFAADVEEFLAAPA